MLPEFHLGEPSLILEEKRRLESLLLERIKQRKDELQKVFEQMNGHWGYEDGFYRFYHTSYKVYGVQNLTEKALAALHGLLPERKFNPSFNEIIHAGTGKTFDLEHNKNWDAHTRPLLEAFMHSKFMIEMAIRYADLPEAPETMPSGWAALLYLYELR